MKTSNIKCLPALNGISKPVAIAKTENERIRRLVTSSLAL